MLGFDPIGSYAVADALLAPAPASPLDTYLGLVTSEHNQKPNFMATLGVVLQPFSDTQTTLRVLPSFFDLDAADGVQLDALGVWIGVSRYISGTALNDTRYRMLLKGCALANRWDGTVGMSDAIWEAIFDYGGTPSYSVFTLDNGDLTMTIGVVGSQIPDTTTMSIITSGVVKVRPMGIRIKEFAVATVPNAPLFGFGAESSNVAGFGVGCAASMTLPST